VLVEGGRERGDLMTPESGGVGEAVEEEHSGTVTRLAHDQGHVLDRNALRRLPAHPGSGLVAARGLGLLALRLRSLRGRRAPRLPLVLAGDRALELANAPAQRAPHLRKPSGAEDEEDDQEEQDDVDR